MDIEDAASVPVTAKKVQKGDRERAEKWKDEETRALFDVWTRYYKKLNSMTNKASLYIEMSTAMSEKGFLRTPDMIKKKIANLRNMYHSTNRSTPTTGGGADDLPEEKWIFWSDVHKLIQKEDFGNANLPIYESPAAGDVVPRPQVKPKTEAKSKAKKRDANGDVVARLDEFLELTKESEKKTNEFMEWMKEDTTKTQAKNEELMLLLISKVEAGPHHPPPVYAQPGQSTAFDPVTGKYYMNM